MPSWLRLSLLGVGAMSSPRYRPAGLLLAWRGRRVMLDGGGTAAGYEIEVAGRRVVWAPEFWQFPTSAAGADLMFADASGWTRPISFAHGGLGHASVGDTAEHARRHGVRRLVFAHIGRPGIRARDAGARPPFGELGVEDRVYLLAAGGHHNRPGRGYAPPLRVRSGQPILSGGMSMGLRAASSAASTAMVRW